MIIQKILELKKMEICINIRWYNKYRPIVIICPGINLSKSGPFFLYSLIARGCYEKGLNTVQFDYFGEGDSSGGYKDITVESLIETMEAVKSFMDDMGGSQYIYIGYGIGNILSSLFYKRKDTVGLCLIAPDLESYRGAKYIVDTSNRKENGRIYDTEYIWPVIQSREEEQFWCSLIGIVPWLYYTPIKTDLLYDLAQIDMRKEVRKGIANILVLYSEESQIEPFRREDLNAEFVYMSELLYREKSEREADGTWPRLWDEIKDKILSWCDRFGFYNNIVQKIEYSHSIHKKTRSYIKLKQTVSRHSITIHSNERLLFGILDLPSITQISHVKKIPCVIYEPGLGGSRVDMCRLGPWLSKELAIEGYAFFRYDSNGSGVSEGEFYNMTWSSRYADLQNVISRLGKIPFIDIENIFLISYSAGAKVACLAANRINAVKGCVLWSPHLIEPADIREPPKKLELLDNKKLVSPLSGLWLGYDFFIDSNNYDFPREYEESRIPMLVVIGDQPSEDNNIDYIKSAYKKDGMIVQYPGAHCFLYQYVESIIKDTITYIIKLRER